MTPTPAGDQKLPNTREQNEEQDDKLTQRSSAVNMPTSPPRFGYTTRATGECAGPDQEKQGRWHVRRETTKKVLGVCRKKKVVFSQKKPS